MYSIFYITYSTFTFEVTVKGKPAESTPKTVDEFEDYIDETVTNILNFVNTIATDEYFTSATAELVTMTIPEIPTDDEDLEEGATVEATTKVVLYSYQGR